MFSIHYQHTNYSTLIKDFAAKMAVPVKKDFVIIPPHIGDGYFKYMILSNDLECLITDLKLNQDIYLCQKSSQEEFYTLRFDESATAENLVVKIDNKYIWEGKRQNASVLLTSSLFDFAYMVSKGTILKSINILISKTWLLKYIGVNKTENADEILKKYLTLKTDSYNFIPFDIEYMELFNSIMNHQDDSNARNVAVERLVMMMVEKFVSELAPKLNIFTEKNSVKISADEVKRLIAVESYLVKNFSVPPPTIPVLSRVAAMSTTSLKNKFKKMYGSSLHEYFQKGRMQRAKILMLTHKYSIKEVGSQLGYSNLSNFSIAFKKEFKHLPSHFLMRLAKS